MGKGKATLTMINTCYGELVFHNDDLVIGHNTDGYPITETDTIVRADSDVPQFFTIEDAKVVCADVYELKVEWRHVRDLMEAARDRNPNFIFVIQSDDLDFSTPDAIEVIDAMIKQLASSQSRFIEEMGDNVESVDVSQEMIDNDDIPY